MRGAVLYVKYIVAPAIVIVAIVWAVHIVGAMARKISRKNEKKRRKT